MGIHLPKVVTMFLGTSSPISVSFSGRTKLLPSSLSSSVKGSSSVRFSNKNVACGVKVHASSKEAKNNQTLLNITFEPFEELKKELLHIPTMPHASLARQNYHDQCEAALNAQIKFFKESSMEERHHAEMMMEYQALAKFFD
ncbi:unnamed protein product [Lupinus luteus]|uniref:Ferritin n=1 Tax=Lupinus luteus TaxID=3873 RepID=A0AAV1WEY0_LUPLU